MDKNIYAIIAPVLLYIYYCDSTVAGQNRVNMFGIAYLNPHYYMPLLHYSLLMHL